MSCQVLGPVCVCDTGGTPLSPSLRPLRSPFLLSLSPCRLSHPSSLTHIHTHTHSFSSHLLFTVSPPPSSLPRSLLPSLSGLPESLPLSSPALWASPQGSHPFSLRLLLSRLLPSLSGLSPERSPPPFAPSLLSASLPVSLFPFSPSCISALGLLSSPVSLLLSLSCFSSSAPFLFSTRSLPPRRCSSPLFLSFETTCLFLSSFPSPDLNASSSSLSSFRFLFCPLTLLPSPLGPWPPHLFSPVPLLSPLSFFLPPPPLSPSVSLPAPPQLSSHLSFPCFSPLCPLLSGPPCLCFSHFSAYSPLSGPLSPPPIFPALPLPSSHPSLLSSLNLSFSSSLLFLTLQSLSSPLHLLSVSLLLSSLSSPNPSSHLLCLCLGRPLPCPAPLPRASSP
eukprot:XP_028334061.1 leucine-rich repeat extensin-like protein 5 [Physeter catodon]